MAAETSTDGTGTGGTMTRDLSTLGEDGPSLTGYEAPSARAAYTERPAFSPVAQPGLSPEIWYHTVPGQGQIAGYAPPTNGMIARLNGATQTIKVDTGGGGKPKRKRRPKPKRKDEKESREQQRDENQREARRDRRGRRG